jgi:endonuclease YncB( thermonuclease family)
MNKYCCFFAKKQQSTTIFDDITLSDTIPFVPNVCIGKVVKVYDGDTITIAAQPYQQLPIYKFSIRLAGIDTPEIKSHDPREKQMAIAARDALYDKIFGEIVILGNVTTEKYGRILADVYCNDLHINQWLLDNHLAIPYHGGTKTPFPRDTIIL